MWTRTERSQGCSDPLPENNRERTLQHGKRIDGKAVAAQIKQELKEQVQQLAKDNITVTLAVIQVGQDPASCVYVRNKQRTCEELGIHSLSYELEETTSEEKLLSLIQELNAREDVDGILVQLPLPGHINEKMF